MKSWSNEEWLAVKVCYVVSRGLGSKMTGGRKIGGTYYKEVGLSLLSAKVEGGKWLLAGREG